MNVHINITGDDAKYIAACIQLASRSAEEVPTRGWELIAMIDLAVATARETQPTNNSAEGGVSRCS